MMAPFNLSQDLQMAQLKQQMVLREFAAAAQAAPFQKESRLARQFRLMFRVRRLMHRFTPGMARMFL